MYFMDNIKGSVNIFIHTRKQLYSLTRAFTQHNSKLLSKGKNVSVTEHVSGDS